jgi:uncharacterized protein YcbK (DUF882 family)
MLLPLLPLVAAMSTDAHAPVTVELFDENHEEWVTLTIARDGTVDDENRKKLKYVFRCKRTNRKHMIAKGTLAMFADVAARWRGYQIDIISAYRASRREPSTSLHRAARAIDFRIRGVSTIPVRDYMWSKFRNVGVGWYPEHRFLHLDYRPDRHDTAWTFRNGLETYRPTWAEKIRPPYEGAGSRPSLKKRRRAPTKPFT